MGFAGRVERALGSNVVPSSPTIGFIAEAPEPHFAYFFARRLVDAIAGAVLLLLAMPVLLAASLAILLTTGRNPLLLQRRVGLRGETFLMLKLRTMRDDEALSCVGRRGVDASATELQGAAMGLPPIVAKVRDNPRVTPVGALLRRTSIDELPQLVNVLFGQMSLVGPRPMLPHEVATLPHAWQRRFGVQPGLSGLWQVSGRSSLPVSRWMALDRLYLQRRSLAFDLLLLLRTVGAVVTMRGAW
jgi:lipopolysaccharide/colanic/teichoic acid biosynthesis glycosyltransferase